MFGYCLAILDIYLLQFVYIFLSFWTLKYLIYFGYFNILNLKLINIFKYLNLFWIYSDTQNTLVWFGFGSGSLDTKILNPFRYLTNFGLGSVVFFFLLNSVRFYRILIYCLALDLSIYICSKCPICVY